MRDDTVYIDNDADFIAAMQAVGQADVLAVDTEFARFNTYYPMVGLVQIYDGRCCYLVDPLPLSDLSPLADVLTDTNIIKVFHSGSEDMEVFQYCLGTVPTPVFDSQIAAALLGVGFSLSYQALVAHYLDLNISKDETRSDWLQRPLTESQLDYAAMDVIHLYEVYDLQREALESRNRTAWVYAETAGTGAELPTTVPPDEVYLRAKGMAGLNRRQLAVARALLAWRERLARERNVPRNRVIDNKAINAIARLREPSRQALQEVTELTPRQSRKYGDDLLFEINRALQAPETSYPEAIAQDRTPVDSKLLKRLRAAADHVAKAADVAPEILIRRRDLEDILRQREVTGAVELPRTLTGWRQELLGDSLARALSS